MVTACPTFKIGDKVLNKTSNKKGTISFVHISNMLENIFYYNIIYDDNSRASFASEDELQRIYEIRELI